MNDRPYHYPNPNQRHRPNQIFKIMKIAPAKRPNLCYNETMGNPSWAKAKGKEKENQNV